MVDNGKQITVVADRQKGIINNGGKWPRLGNGQWWTMNNGEQWTMVDNGLYLDDAHKGI